MLAVLEVPAKRVLFPATSVRVLGVLRLDVNDAEGDTGRAKLDSRRLGLVARMLRVPEAGERCPGRRREARRRQRLGRLEQHVEKRLRVHGLVLEAHLTKVRQGRCQPSGSRPDAKGETYKEHPAEATAELAAAGRDVVVDRQDPLPNAIAEVEDLAERRPVCESENQISAAFLAGQGRDIRATPSVFWGTAECAWHCLGLSTIGSMPRSKTSCWRKASVSSNVPLDEKPFCSAP